jgi:hypothetical protein
MTDTYREQLLASVQEMQREQSRQLACNSTDEEINNRICDSLGLPRATQFTDEQLEMLIASHALQQQTEKGQL